jgi:nicotinate-nucleotide pyrophosphorylase (carboxylating)
VATPAPHESSWLALLDRALAEDLGPGDVTSAAVLPADRSCRAVLEAREPLVVCGLFLAQRAFERMDPRLVVQLRAAEGDAAGAGTPLLVVTGCARSVLAAERTALNFVARTCGIATHTRRFVDAVRGTRALIVDTRKTIPGWRVLDKYAVAVGGGTNHRAGLYDAILIKDNHVAAAGGVGAAVKAARSAAAPHLFVQVEVESEDQADEAIASGADSLLLDNRSVAETAKLVQQFGERTLLESSGGIDLDNVRAYAETGVHRISIGALTHSAPSADLAVEMLEGGDTP